MPLAQATFFLALIFLGVFTLGPIRRAHYELFFYTHVTFVAIFIFVVLWHATMSWYYIIGTPVLECQCV